MFNLHRITWEVEKHTIAKLEKGELCISERLRDPLYENPAYYDYFAAKHLLFVRRNSGDAHRSCAPMPTMSSRARKTNFASFHSTDA